MLAYTLQIYFDFCGYTDMALGAARMFNIQMPVNFNSPYHATNIREFWQRWHMTLSRFLREYLYIPLGGNRHGEGRTAVNVMATFLLGGLWHGAAWTFVVWGALHGGATSLPANLGAYEPASAARDCVGDHVSVRDGGVGVLSRGSLATAVTMLRAMVGGNAGQGPGWTRCVMRLRRTRRPPHSPWV